MISPFIPALAIRHLVVQRAVPTAYRLPADATDHRSSRDYGAHSHLAGGPRAADEFEVEEVRRASEFRTAPRLHGSTKHQNDPVPPGPCMRIGVIQDRRRV